MVIVFLQLFVAYESSEESVVIWLLLLHCIAWCSFLL